MGGNTLLAGDLTKGWYGEIQASNFITGDALASDMGFSDGTAYNSDAGWLKFSLDSKTLYIAKKPFRYGISWDQINAVNLVYGGRTIVINGLTYKVRLIQGRGDGLNTAITSGYDIQPCWNSEWNRTLYHISGRPFKNDNNTLASEGIYNGDWAQYSENEIWMYFTVGPGAACWCQEGSGTGSSIASGYAGVSSIMSIPNNNTTTANGWRPCLELVS